MAIACTFAFNRRAIATLSGAGVGMFPAFPGQRDGRNNPAAAGKRDIGPLPTGRHFIVAVAIVLLIERAMRRPRVAG